MKKILFVLTCTVIFIGIFIAFLLLYNDYVISNSITLASRYYDDKEYDRSLNEIEFVLVREPKNIPANELYRKILIAVNEETDRLNEKIANEKKEDRDWKDKVLSRISDLERKMGKTTVIEKSVKTNYSTEKPEVKQNTQSDDKTAKDNSKKIAEYISRGKDAFNNKEYAAAKVLFLKALNLDKNNPEALVYLGGSMYYENPKDRKNLTECDDLILKGLSIDDEIWIGHRFLAQLKENEGKNDDAVNEYRYALELNSNDEESLILLAKLQYKLKQTTDAETTFDKAKDVNKDSVTASYYLALTKYENGNKDEAKKLLTDLVKKAPNFFNGYILLGNIYKENKEFDEAIKNYETALRLDDKYEAYQGLGDCYYSLNNLFKAEDNYKNAVSKNPLISKDDKTKINFAYEKIAIIEMKNGKIPAAGEYALKALDNEYKSSDIYYITGLYYSFNNMDDKAIDAYEKCLSLDSQYIDCYAGIARSYLNINNNNLAIKYSETGIALDKSNYRLYLNEADALNNLKEYEKAVDYYTKSMNLQKPDKETLFKTGICLKSSKNYEKSFDYFQKAIGMDKNYFDAYFELGDAYYKDGKYREAKDCLDEIVKRKPDYERRSEVDKLITQILRSK
jgi:tetratricopeptide (TPR) repeat protein